WKDADLLALGAVADLVRTEEVGDTVTIHKSGEGTGVFWIDPQGATELELLRAVAIARIAGPSRARIGMDWTRHGVELSQVALGFGASHLRGTIAGKSGLPILEDESKKVKGQGNVSVLALRRAEISALVKYAGRLPVFFDDLVEPQQEAEAEAAAHV